MKQSKVFICGGGKIGHMIAHLLSSSGDYLVTVGDVNKDQFAKFQGMKNVETVKVNLSDQKALEKAAAGTNFIMSALPFSLTTIVAGAARKIHAHYVDLTEDIRASEEVKKLAKGAESAFIPQSGLAPGFISIAANDLAKKFDTVDELKMRVGALAKYPNNAIKYNLTWSTAGLVNEYCEPCNALVDGELIQLEPLEGYEHFTLDGMNYECFNTSGGIGTLGESLKGKVKNLTYKSIRYPGHLDVMRFLINDLKMKDKQDMLVKILDDAIPATKQDVVLVYVSASGHKNGHYLNETIATKIYSGMIEGMECSGIQITTAGAACAVIDLVREGKLPQRGFIKQEDIKLEDFLNNRFGKVYAPGKVTAKAV